MVLPKKGVSIPHAFAWFLRGVEGLGRGDDFPGSSKAEPQFVHGGSNTGPGSTHQKR